MRSAGVVLAVLLAMGGLVALGSPAMACGAVGEPPCSGDGQGDHSTTSSGDESSGTVRENYNGNGQACSVYANGTGMGSYCVSGSGGTLKTLRERFGDQVFQQCRYRKIPDGMPIPFNSRPGEGHYMLQICLQNINFDTYSGGRNRLIKVNIVFVPNGTDTEDNNNALNTFLWKSIENEQQLPVPFMVTRPNVVPLVGIPTFFTFQWLDPGTRDVVAQGPYQDKPGGGPYKRVVTRGGLVMEATASKITIDPRQKGIPSTTCRPDTPYTQGAKPADQPADACSITFPRSSASARELSKVNIPSQFDEQFYGLVEIEWHIKYGHPGEMHELGDGFTMRITQGIPVQEIQAPNQPPAVIY